MVATKYCYSLLRVPRGKKVEKPCSRATTKVFLINCNLRLRFAQVQSRQLGKNNLIKIHKRTILFSRNTISKDINCAFFIFCVISTKKNVWPKKVVRKWKNEFDMNADKRYLLDNKFEQAKFKSRKTFSDRSSRIIWMCRVRTPHFLLKEWIPNFQSYLTFFNVLVLMAAQHQ